MPITHICRISGQEFTITDQEIALLDKLSPIIWGEKFSIPLPTISPKVRLERKLPYKNYLSLFKRTDSLTGESIISSYPPESTYTVFSQPHWWGDSWNPLDYGTAYDPEVPITDQIYRIWHEVPVPALDNSYKKLENSEYVSGCGPSKDCYLTSNSAYNERCLYGWFIFRSVNILDANYITECENCSYSQHLWKCYDVHQSWDTSSSSNSWYLYSCDGCQYILGWVWLKNQKYHILGSPCSEEDYKATRKKIEDDPIFRKEFEKKVLDHITSVWLETNILTGSTESTGDFCYDSKNTTECYNVGDSEDVLYITESFKTRDSAHISMWWDGTILSYDSIDVGENISNVYFSVACWGGAYYNLYSHKCNNCQYIFGCSWLRNKEYCIFNKQYQKEEWQKIVQKIIQQMQNEGTWWEFLDPKYAPFAYNESLWDTFSPLKKEEALVKWFRWSDRFDAPPEGITKVIPGDRLPGMISWIPDDVLHWAIQCTKTGKLFQIQPLELEIHRKFSIPLPRIHPVERIKLRLGWDRRIFSFDF